MKGIPIRRIVAAAGWEVLKQEEALCSLCSMAKITMAGSYVALITPFTESDEVDYAKIEELVEWHVAEGYELCSFMECGISLAFLDLRSVGIFY